MTYYERDLPHWHPAGKLLFLTWRLAGSLPASAIRKLHTSRLPAGRKFLAMDAILDQAASGPQWLKDEQVARCVIGGLSKGEELGHYRLIAFVVMSNHVHALLEPKAELDRIMNSLKGATARQANRLLGRTGTHFWQDETFDHWVRNESEFTRIVAYIENNPVKAGLVDRPERWRWSSAALRVRAGT